MPVLSPSLLLTFLHGIGLLAVVALGYDMILRGLARRPRLRGLTLGVFFGAAAVLSMLQPAEVAPGIITDARAIMSALAALFGGPLAALPAIVLPATYRLWLGGVGAPAGVAGVILAGLAGLLYSRFPVWKDGRLPLRHLMALGCIASAAQMCSALLLPTWDMALLVLTRSGPALFPATTVGIVLLGIMLSRDHMRLAASQGVAASEERLRFLADNAQDVIMRIGAGGRVRHATDAARTILGRDPADVRGMTLEELLHPHDRSTVAASIAALTPDAPSAVVRCRAIHTGGHPVWVEAAIRRAEGEDSEYVAVLRDITVRVGVEEKLNSARRAAEAAHAFAEALFEQAQAALAVVGGGNRLVRVNAAFCRLTGWESADLTGRDAATVLPPRQGPGSWEADLTRRDGTTRTVLAVESVVESMTETTMAEAGGQPLRLVALMDISDVARLTRELQAAREEEAAARAQAETANRSKGDFLASLSHELRTPLNAVIGFADLIAREAEGPVGTPVYRDFAVNIRDSGQHLLELINEILDHARAEAGMLTLHEDTLDLDAAVEFAVRMLQARANRAGVTLTVVRSTGLRYLRGDEKRLRQILLNLISNAVKYTPSGGEVTIRLMHAPGGSPVIEVTDTGIGIPESDMDRVLQAFARVESPGNRRVEGTGLGLPLTKRLVELHGGVLTLRSQLGVGTTVTVTLPPWRAVERLPHCSPAPQPAPVRRPLTILLADDDPLLRMSTTALLETWGHHVLEAANANEALTILRGDAPVDLLFTDMVMPPGMTGTELARQAERLRPGIPVLLTSGFAGHAVAGEAGAEGGYAMISKPFLAVELKERLERVAGRLADEPAAACTPILPAPRKTPLPAAEETLCTALPQPFHVLVAEDQPLNQRLVMVLLNGLGCTVDVVGDGAAAVDAVRHHAYDLVLMDVNMPVLDGLEAARRIRRLPPPAGTLPIYAMTAGGLDEDLAECTAAGMNGHVAKPLDHAELARLVRHLEETRTNELTLA
ncbi:PAS domain S-box-containing protein [Azospirillum fermentarium]|uniref:response regulator n=1 Tax=Azospirillum fermentarium TaxID=1233114 RepID=UPI0022276359|nr:response regulator [Azospirillum fermentarium]MCW2245354.1 PAS domain S-box-containing protein [Azospirillum fermentarium]